MKKLSGSEDSLRDMLSMLDSSTEIAETTEADGANPVVSESSPTSTTEMAQSYSSPTLMNLPPQLKPKEDFTCMFCPAAMWLVKGDAVTCFCRMMRKEIFTSAEEDSVPVLLCDGPYLAEEEAR